MGSLRHEFRLVFQVLASTNGGAILGNWSLAVRSSLKEGGMYRRFQ